MLKRTVVFLISLLLLAILSLYTFAPEVLKVFAENNEPTVQYNPWLNPEVWSAAEIADHLADEDYQNEHYHGRIVPLSDSITVQRVILDEDGNFVRREIIETCFDYLRNGGDCTPI